MTNPVEKLQNAMRQLNMFDAMIDENDSHYIIMLADRDPFSALTINKLFVECARVTTIMDVLSEKVQLDAIGRPPNTLRP